MSSIKELEEKFEEMVKNFSMVSPEEIPDISLYMDQVTTFMEQKLSPYTRDPGRDKVLTKTMINNYTKNSLLIPPDKKKYGMDHMLLLLMIFYMKSFLSISDIEAVLAPVRDRYVTRSDTPLDKKKAAKAAKIKTGKEKGTKDDGKVPKTEDDNSSVSRITLRMIYKRIEEDITDSLPEITEDMKKDFEAAGTFFSDVPDISEEDREVLQKFDLICRLSSEIYIKKLFIERLIDEEKEENND